MLAMVLASSMPLQAQSFDEANLIGRWVRSAVMQPVDNYLVSIDSLWFGGGMWSYTRSDNNFQYYGCGKFCGLWQGKYYEPGESDLAEYYNTTLINDFSITNGNKLHITLGADEDVNFSLIFKIVSFTPTELVVQPLGSSNEIRFTKVANQPTSIKGARTSPNVTVPTIYDISGKKLPKENKGINIVKTDNGRAYKRLMK